MRIVCNGRARRGERGRHRAGDGHYADFHALRKTFITNLSRLGVPPEAAQTLACHSDINLTINTYTMLGMLEQVAAVEALPPVPESKAGKRLRATG